MFLRYNELRAVDRRCRPSLDARTLVGERRDAREAAFEIRPPDWVGTATEDALAFPYLTLLGLPGEVPPAALESRKEQIVGLAASAGVVEGPARVVESLAEFDQVQAGDILVCRMTNPGLGRAVHEDQRPRHRCRRHGRAPGRRGPRVRAPRRRRHLERDPADHDGPAPARRPARPAWWTCSGERCGDDRPARAARPGQGRPARAHRARGLPARASDSSRRRSPASSASARPRCARRCATSISSASSCTSPTAAAACARLQQRAARGVPGARRARGARLAPRGGAHQRGRSGAPRRAARGDARRGALADPLGAGPRQRALPRDDRRGGRQRDARAAVVAARAVRAHVPDLGAGRRRSRGNSPSATGRSSPRCARATATSPPA